MTFYEHSHFQGARKTIQGNWSFTTDGCWNDRISSIHIPRGWRVVIYEHNWAGQSMTLTSNWSVRNWNDWWNDRISSIRVIPPNVGQCGTSFNNGVTFFEHQNFNGASRTVSQDVQSLTSGWWNDKISSMRIPHGWTVILYEHCSFRGNSIVLTSDWTVLNWNDCWNDRVSSIKVIPPRRNRGNNQGYGRGNNRGNGQGYGRGNSRPVNGRGYNQGRNNGRW